MGIDRTVVDTGRTALAAWADDADRRAGGMGERTILDFDEPLVGVVVANMQLVFAAWEANFRALIRSIGPRSSVTCVWKLGRASR